jgi:hypothetical protein
MHTTSAPLTTTGFAAVRRSSDTGYEWIDATTFGWMRDMARDKVLETQRCIPGWAALHPVVRVVRVTLTAEDTRADDNG